MLVEEVGAPTWCWGLALRSAERDSVTDQDGRSSLLLVRDPRLEGSHVALGLEGLIVLLMLPGPAALRPYAVSAVTRCPATPTHRPSARWQARRARLALERSHMVNVHGQRPRPGTGCHGLSARASLSHPLLPQSECRLHLVHLSSPPPGHLSLWTYP